MTITETTPTWYLYILDCDGRSYYTGITTDADRRVRQHRSGKPPGANATRGFSRIVPVYTVAIGSRSDAQRAEYRLKRLSREEKGRIVNAQPTAAQLLHQLKIAAA